MSVEHVFGTTEVPREPQRVVALSSADQDAALALGVVPVAVPRQTAKGVIDGMTPWFQAGIKKAGAAAPALLDLRDEVDPATVEKFDPDVILATGRVLSPSEFESLGAIAPVLAQDPDGLTWRASLDAIGAALGRTAEAASVQESTERVIREGAADQQGMDGTTFILAHLYPGAYDVIGVHLARDPRVAMLNDFGLVNAPIVGELAARDGEVAKVAASRAADLKSEILLLLPGSPKDVKALESNAQLSRIPALDSGRAYAELSQLLQLALSQPSTLAIPKVIERYLPDVALISDF